MIDWILMPNLPTLIVEAFARACVGLTAFWVFSGR